MNIIRLAEPETGVPGAAGKAPRVGRPAAIAGGFRAQGSTTCPSFDI